MSGEQDVVVVAGGGAATDREEFTVFVREHAATLYRVAFLLCGDQHRAQDLVQQTLERTYRSWGRVRDGSPLAYARTVLANLRVDTWRRTRREHAVEPDDLAALAGGPVAARGASPAEDRLADRVADRDRVVRALAQLPVKQRRVVVLRFLLDLGEAETARTLRLPVGTVKSQSSRGLARLRELLGEPAVRPTVGVEPS
ncbi:SigE family RNA polymerase sigma factor [Cellulosimicrobium marinum]|uniref:SigE family RNA polymerase sigma factor n=1 Tax=Cellulosimicrobium marinum TaxID=1638992 RepID=UPI001E5C8B93|nr:SigE family RNA polymerase sigma factor [Cellulosimicrobium marinum]MCB7135531.1 SigE family RNA polymerase sigma factor [Cellulosimicrobium marinum]